MKYNIVCQLKLNNSKLDHATTWIMCWLVPVCPDEEHTMHSKPFTTWLLLLPIKPSMLLVLHLLFFTPLFWAHCFLYFECLLPFAFFLCIHSYCKSLFFLQTQDLESPPLWKPLHGPLLRCSWRAVLSVDLQWPCVHIVGRGPRLSAGRWLILLDSMLLEGSNISVFLSTNTE